MPAISSRSRNRTARAGTPTRSPRDSPALDGALRRGATRSVPGAGRDRGVSRDAPRRGRDRLGRDRRAVSRARRGWSRHPSCELNRAGRDRDGRRSRCRASARRRARRHGRARRVPPPARDPRRFAAPSRTSREAALAYRDALALAATDSERRYLDRRLAECRGLAGRPATTTTTTSATSIDSMRYENPHRSSRRRTARGGERTCELTVLRVRDVRDCARRRRSTPRR